MQWLHACYGIGVTIGPIIMTIALTSLDSWQAGYRAVGGFQLALAACFVLTLRTWDQGDGSPAAAFANEDVGHAGERTPVPYSTAYRQRCSFLIERFGIADVHVAVTIEVGMEGKIHA